MTITPLPATLKNGDKLVQTRYTPHEILEVFYVDGDHVLLMTDNGNRKFHEPLMVETLRGYDYELVCNDPEPADKRNSI